MKLKFMESILSYVSTYLGVLPPTSAAHIVTGAEAEKTNILLQYIAMAAAWKKNANGIATPGQDPVSASIRATTSSASYISVHVKAWLKK